MAQKKTPAAVFLVIGGLLLLSFVGQLPKCIALIRDGDGSDPEIQGQLFAIALFLIASIVLLYKGVKRNAESDEKLW